MRSAGGDKKTKFFSYYFVFPLSRYHEKSISNVQRTSIVDVFFFFLLNNFASQGSHDSSVHCSILKLKSKLFQLRKCYFAFSLFRLFVDYKWYVYTYVSSQFHHNNRTSARHLMLYFSYKLNISTFFFFFYFSFAFYTLYFYFATSTSNRCMMYINIS